jgi:hypothetical protein
LPLRLLTATIIALGLLSGGAPPANASDYTQQIVDLTNAERAKAGLSPLVVSAALSSSAQGYAAAMATQGFFNHIAPDGSTLVQRDVAAGYSPWSYLEENIAAGQGSPAEAVAAWMNSPEHRTNLLSPRVHEIGVGYSYRAGSPYGTYWVQEFGDRPGAPTTTASRVSAAPRASAAPVPVTSWTAPTGHTVSGAWFTFLRSHGDVDVFGLPRSDVTTDPMTGQTVQYFQRVVLEWHPENPPDSRIQRRLLGDDLYPGVDLPVVDLPASADFFPFSLTALTGLGHGVSNYAPDGEPTYFKDFFDSHGGVTTFGYPKEEPTLRDGMWTQRFQAAVFQYHPELDQDGVVAGTNLALRHFRVQLELLGDEFIGENGLPYQ